jgi:hypothetical protein
MPTRCSGRHSCCSAIPAADSWAERAELSLRERDPAEPRLAPTANQPPPCGRRNEHDKRDVEPCAGCVHPPECHPGADDRHDKHHRGRPSPPESHRASHLLTHAPLGAHQLTGKQRGLWDGRLESGGRVRAGAYFLSVSLDGQPIGSKKLLVLR